MQDHAADELDVEMTLAQRALRRFADGREGRNQNVIERDAFRDLLLELVGPGFQRIVRKAFQFLFERVDLADPGQIAADTPLIGGSKQLAGNGADHAGGAPNLAGFFLISCRHGRICLRRSGMRHFSGKFDTKRVGKYQIANAEREI